MTLFAGLLGKAVAAAATLTGKRFALLVASSLVATSGIVAVGASGGGTGSLAAAAAQALLEEEPTAVAAAPSPEATPTPSPSSSPQPASGGEAAPSGPLPSPSPAPEAAPTPEPEEPAPPAEPELPEAGPIKHVFLVSLASPGYEAAFGTASQMPYLSGTLRPQGVLLTNYSLLSEAGVANGVATISGEKPTAATQADCPAYEKCLYPVETLTLADQLGAARFSWHAYLEGMSDETGKPANCVYPAPGAVEAPVPGGYSPRLNPFVYFHSQLDLGDCATNDVPGAELAKDLKTVDSTANFSYISPNLCNAGFYGQCPEGTPDGAAAADAYLAKVVPEILASPAYKRDGLLIVSFSAADPAPPAEPAAAPSTNPLKTGALLVSSLAAPGSTDAAHYNPYSLLRSSEELFGLEPLGAAAGAKVHSFASAFTAGNAGD
ncbi:MAG TPA: alkaline phosphatase family protein [Solirubrobacterales bacterium]|nr:alkaline phosphatase family protein [Solirubrobacterales bacterium]